MKHVFPLSIESGMSQTGSYVLTMCDPESNMLIPIIIGEHEAHSILLAQNGTPTRRPTTHETMKATLQAFGLTITKASIDRMEEGIFYATLYVNDGFNNKTIDSRSTDAIALALLFAAPIEMAEPVIEQCGFHSEDTWSAPTSTAGLENINALEEKLHKCIEEEDYEGAADIQAKIDKLSKH